MSSLLGGQKITPTTLNPTVGTSNQNNFFQSLFNNTMHQGADGAFTFSGVTPYTGQTSPSQSSTINPSVYGAWQPWNAGTMYLANMIGNNTPGLGTASPYNATIMQNGGTSGPGTLGMSDIMQFGTPSQGVGQQMQQLAQFGTNLPGGQMQKAVGTGSALDGSLMQQLVQNGGIGPGASILQGLAAGKTTGPASGLAAFLPGGSMARSMYASPPVTFNPTAYAGGY